MGLCCLAGWAFIRGTLPPGTTVAQGEAHAIQVDRLEPGGMIASDCWAAVCLWLRAAWRQPDKGEPMWDYQHAYEVHPRQRDSGVKWIPAHKTFEEAITKIGPSTAWPIALPNGPPGPGALRPIWPKPERLRGSA